MMGRKRVEEAFQSRNYTADGSVTAFNKAFHGTVRLVLGIMDAQE